MIRYLFQIAQNNQRFNIYPPIGFQLAALTHLTLNKDQKLDPSAFQFGNPERKSSVWTVKGLSGAYSEHNVRVIRMHGFLTMSGDYCTYGMEDYARMVKRAYADPSIHAIMIDACGPGGEARYTETLSEVIGQKKKPVVTWANQMVASAHYRVLAGSNEILLSGPSAEVGSIGTIISYLDFTRYLKDQGVDIVQMLATKSTDKRKFKFHEPSEDDKKLIIEEYIDPHNNLFIEQTKAFRPFMNEEVYKAGLFMGDKAIEMGLADGYATFEAAIERAATLAL